MLTAIATLLITSLIGGVFGSVATYTYIDSSKGKYCDKMSENVESDEEFYVDEQQGEDMTDSYYNNPEEEDNEEY